MSRWVREPLLLFLALGAALFVLYAVVGEDEEWERDSRIVVSAQDIERIRANWTRQWGRPPTSVELQGLVEDHVREEVLYREALALGLAEDDTIIRRRLAQKMEFLSEDLVDQAEPTAEELQSWFEQNAEQYRRPILATFTHIYLNRDRRGAAAVADARALLGELRKTPDVEQPWSRGDRFMLESWYERLGESEMGRLFGSDFAEQVVQLDPGPWHGPVESGYGLHLVRVAERIDSSLPDLAQVEAEALRDFKYERRRDFNEAFYTTLRERYDVEIDESAIGEAVAQLDEGSAP